MARRRVLFFALIAFLALAVIMLGLAGRGVGTLRRASVTSVDFADVADGTYEGRYEYARWSYSVRLTVKDGRAESVDILFPAGDAFGQKVAAAVLSQQSLSIDTVSGATASTKAVLKALENALSGD